MNFKDIIKLTEAANTSADSFRTTGEAMRKDSAKSGASNNKAKDAARKRAERAKQIPRDRKSKGELVREMIAVKTQSGRVQLIFKDSFNKNLHTKLNKSDVLTEDEAKQYTGDANFEQTRASKLLFGDVKSKEKKEPEKKKGGEEETKEKKAKPSEDGAEAQGQPQKAKRLSKEEILQAMQGMNGEQLAGMPKELQQEYFQSMRAPMASKDFDVLNFENLSVEFGINSLSSTPYNQQVLNALLFVAKLKAGASEQELQTLMATSTASMDFTKTAFLQASKILSQIGDECIQNLVSSIEAGTSGMYSEGTPELQCGEYKFKISAGGEFTINTNSLNQSGKIIRGIIGGAISRTLMDPKIAASDPTVKKLLNDVEASGENYSAQLLPDESVAAILSDPELVKEFQSYEIKSPSGKSLGFAIDENGNVNPAISVSAYQNSINKAGQELFKGGKKNTFLKSLTANIMKTSLRGDGMTDPKMSPNHVITANGIFKLTDDYIDEVSNNAIVTVKKSDDLIDNSNLSSYKKSAIDNLQKWRTVVEETEPKAAKKTDIKKLFIDRKTIDPLGLIVQNSIRNLSFDINASLLPGFKPEDINAVEYNYVTIGKKTTKIPVVRSEKLSTQLIGENYSVINEMLIEALTNNFLLSRLNQVKILDDGERNLIEKYGPLLLEEEDLRVGCLIPMLNKIYSLTEENLDYLVPLFEEIIDSDLEEEYKRDYKKEYRNYHGKKKQKKERAARTAARELMIRKGVVKKGSKKDIDHKKALRNGGSNGINNLRLRDRSDNRSDNGHKKGEKQNKDWK